MAASSSRYTLQLISTGSFRPNEEVVPERVVSLRELILQDNTWKEPIIVEPNYFAILDGHHRFAVAKSLNLTHVPAYVVEQDDLRLQLYSWRPDILVQAQDIIEKACSGNLYPPKTTRHVLTPPPPSIEIPLSVLG